MRMLIALVGLAAAAVALAGAAQARMQVPSGDTCVFSKSSAAYTVNIAVRTGTPQDTIAFGAPGLTVTTIGISGNNGNFTTASLPAKTSGAWVSDTPLTGNLAVTLTVKGTATGPIRIVPSNGSSSTTYDALTCSAKSVAAPKLAIKVGHATYSTVARAWHLIVTVPVAGRVSAKQAMLRNTVLKRKIALIDARQRGIKSPGKVTLTLKPTPSGLARLTAQNAIKITLLVTLDANDGRQAHKSVSLSLRK